MAQGESPAAARRRLRLALRKAREAKGLKQGQVAEALDWSLSKVQRIEAGEVTVSSSDLKAALMLFDITDGDRIDQLLETARTSRRKGWWDEQQYRQHLSSATMQLLQFEGEAAAIRVYNPSLLPGLIQTRAYAETIFNFWGSEMPEAERHVRLEVRMRRREFVLERPDPPEYFLILDESVLKRQVGSEEVMAEQLSELLSLMKKKKFIARIVPFTRGAPLAMLNHFIILDLGDEEDAILYREAQLKDYIEQGLEAIRLYRHRFESLWDTALSEKDTAALIEQHLDATRHKGGRGQSGGQ